MPHFVTFDGLIASQAGFQERDAFIKLGDIKGEFQADELTGGFDALNEITNLSPEQEEITSIAWPIESLSEAFGDGLMKLGEVIDDIKGDLQTTDLRSDNRFVIERTEAGRYEPGIILDNPGTAPNISGTSGPGGTTFMTETFEPVPGMDSFGV